MHLLLFSSERRLLILSSTAVNQLVTRGAWTKTRRVEVPSPLLLTSPPPQPKQGQRKEREKTLRLKNGAKTRRAELSLQPKQGSQDPWTSTIPTQQKYCPSQSFFSAYHLFLAKTEIKIEHLRCPVIKGFIPPFSPKMKASVLAKMADRETNFSLTLSLICPIIEMYCMHKCD